jgi:hypothetical protein
MISYGKFAKEAISQLNKDPGGEEENPDFVNLI